MTSSALIYVRQSRHKEGERTVSPEVQEASCRALPAVKRCDQVEVFTDLDVSGGKMSRPALDAALARIRSGQSAGILVAHIDRFARTLVGGLKTLQEIGYSGGVHVELSRHSHDAVETAKKAMEFLKPLSHG